MEAQAVESVSAPPVSRGEWLLVAALFLLAFLPIVHTANDYGWTYDEPHYVSAGATYADWWARLARGDRSAAQPEAILECWRLNHEHPPLQKSASGLAQRWFGAGGVEPRDARLPSALWFALTTGAIYLFCRGAWGRRGALFAALAFLTLPRVIGHAHFAALDMPIAAWFFITAALTAEAMERDSWVWVWLAGLAFGLALLSKINAFFLLPLLFVWGLGWHRASWPRLVFALVMLGPAVFILGWPWLWVDPIAHLREYLAFHLHHAAYNVWYLGKLYQYAPWHYPFVMIGITTPIAVLALSLGGLARSLPRRSWEARRALLLLGLVIAVAPSALPHSPKYNGVRLFLPAFPFLAALAGGGFAWLQLRVLTLLRATSPGTRRLSALICAALGALLLYPGVRGAADSHPYQLTYYNELVGGVAKATEAGCETIYWGQVLQTAPEFLNQVPEARPRVLVIPKGVIYLLTAQQGPGGLREEVRFTGDEREAGEVDYVMFQCMQSEFSDLCWSLTREAEPTWAVRLEGVPLLVAYDRETVASVLARARK